MSRLDYFTPEHNVKESLSSRVVYWLKLQKEELQTLDSSKSLYMCCFSQSGHVLKQHE